MQIKLVKPSLEYKESFFAAVKEWKTFSSPYATASLKNYIEVKDEDNLNNLLKQLEDNEKGLCVTEGHVPSSTLWFIVDGEMAGTVNCRHNLNSPVLAGWGGHIGYQLRPSYMGKGLAVPMLLKTLDFIGNDLGIEKAMVCCNADNIPSRKTIEHALKERGGEEIEDFIHDGIKSKRYLLYTPLYYRKYASDELGLNDKQKQKFAKEAESLRKNLQLRKK